MTTKSKTKTARRNNRKNATGIARRTNTKHKANDSFFTEVSMTIDGASVEHGTYAPQRRTDWLFGGNDGNAFSPAWTFTVAFNPQHGLTEGQGRGIAREMNLLADRARHPQGPVVVNVPGMEHAYGLTGDQGMMLGAMLLHFIDLVKTFKSSGDLQHMRVDLAEWSDD